MKWEGEWKGSIGFRYDSNSGIDDKAPFYNPNIKNEIKMEGKLFLGLCIVPDLSVIDENVCKAEMDATSGLEVVGKKLMHLCFHPHPMPLPPEHFLSLLLNM